MFNNGGMFRNLIFVNRVISRRINLKMAQEMNEIVKLAQQLNDTPDLDSKITEELLNKLKAMTPC